MWRRDVPLLECSGSDHRKWGNMLNESLNKRHMWKCPLILKARQTNLMPDEVRNIDLALWRFIQAMHKVNAVAVAGPLVTHLGVDGANHTLIDGEIWGPPDGHLINVTKTVFLRNIGQILEQETTLVNRLRAVIGIIFVDFEPHIRKSKCSHKVRIGGSELSVRSHPCDGLVRMEEACGIELKDGRLAEIMLVGKRQCKPRRLNELNGTRGTSRDWPECVPNQCRGAGIDLLEEQQR